MNRDMTPAPRRSIHKSPSSESSSDNSSSTKGTELLKFARCFARLPRDPVSKKLRRPLYVTGALYRYTILFLVRSTVFTASTITFFTILPLLISLSANKTGRVLCKLYCKALMFSLGIKLINHGEKPDLHTPHVFVANHTSFLDYIVLAGHKFPHACIMARHKGLIGWLQNGALAFLNSTAFDREDSEQRKAIKSKLTMQLKENPDCKLLIFPESTCVNNQYIVRFQKGAFDLADDVRICPVAIRYGPETPRSTVFEDEVEEQKKSRRRSNNYHSNSARHQQQHRSRPVSAKSRYRTDKSYRSDHSEDTTEDESNETSLNGWRKHLFRISDDDDDLANNENEEEYHHAASDLDDIPIDRRSRNNDNDNETQTKRYDQPGHESAAKQLGTMAKETEHDWNAVDPYWDTRQSLFQQLFYLMTRWKLETHVHYLPPQTRQRRRKSQQLRRQPDYADGHSSDEVEQDEDPVQFANRIRCDIAKAAQLKVAEFNGRDKKQLLKLIDQQQSSQSSNNELVVTEELSSKFKRSSSARSMDEGYGSSLRLDSLAMTTDQ
ncbi:1-acylglycerol-3-phosphate O-acyltransferase 6 (lysophosphatidic acid acyltransferase, zeta) [Actinomortierella wolfii]|nr:1-acylglycerol-3-phosphate O-acyltransferase 6 (lysophosphatidic acid acyltransferase, zeta) [Actinomortierella wolfii]